MVCENFKNLHRRRASDKVLCDKNIAKHPKYDGYYLGLFHCFIHFLICLLVLVLEVVLLKVKLCQANNYQKNKTNQLLENLTNKKYINVLNTIFVMVLADM